MQGIRGLASKAQFARRYSGQTQSSTQANASELAENTALTLCWFHYILDFLSHGKGPAAVLGLRKASSAHQLSHQSKVQIPQRAGGILEPCASNSHLKAAQGSFEATYPG